MKILVAGSKSFVGQNLRSYYNKYGNYEVVYLSRKQLDFTNSNQFVEICSQLQPDLVIHTAVSLESTNNNIAMYLALEQASIHYGSAVMIGSGAEYSHQRYIPNMPETYFSDRHPPANNHPYHLSKHIISRIHQSSHIDNIFNFRVFGLYGPYEDHTRRLISNNIYNYLLNGTMHVSANHAFDYLYVDDLIEAIHHFADSGKTPSHKTYNVCNGHADRFLSILSEVITELGGEKSQIDIESSEPTNYIYSGDPSLFQDEFDYTIHRTGYRQATNNIKKWLLDSNLLDR